MDKSPGLSTIQSAYSSLTRPTTAAVMKMLSKLCPITQKIQNPRKQCAVDLQKLIGKVSKSHKKTQACQQELVDSLLSWAAELPNEETSTIMREFTDVLGCVNLSFASSSDRLNLLKVHLGSIATREERQRELLSKHVQLKKDFDDAALKFGPQASQAMVCLDAIEENEYNLKLIEQQLARTATTSLREALADYLSWLQGALVTMGNRTNDFASSIREFDPATSAQRFNIANTVKTAEDSSPQVPRIGRLNLRNGDINHHALDEEKNETSKKFLAQQENQPIPRSSPGAATQIGVGVASLEYEADILSKYREREALLTDLRNFDKNVEGWGLHH